MTQYHFFGMDGLPEPIRAVLMDGENPEKKRMRHELRAREQADFWKGLTKDQLVYLSGMLVEIGQTEVETSRMLAGRYLGMAEGQLMQRFTSCGCGTVHRDPSEFIGQLEQEANADQIEKNDAEVLELYKIQDGPLTEEDQVGKWACKKCGMVFESINARIAKSVGDGHEGCREMPSE